MISWPAVLHALQLLLALDFALLKEKQLISGESCGSDCLLSAQQNPRGLTLKPKLPGLTLGWKTHWSDGSGQQ